MLIDYEKLQGLLGFASYEQLRSSHRGWVEEYLKSDEQVCQEEWTGSIAVGNRAFVEEVKACLGIRAKGRAVIESSSGYQVREEPVLYNALLGAQKEDIGPENTYFWSVNP